VPNNGQAKVRSPEEIRAEIEHARAQIQRSAQELKQEMAARADWREWVRRRPVPTLFGAFLVGVWLGSRR
jgi:hypothetical protein